MRSLNTKSSAMVEASSSNLFNHLLISSIETVYDLIRKYGPAEAAEQLSGKTVITRYCEGTRG